MQPYPWYIENPCCYLLTHCNQLWFWFVSQLPWHSVPVHLPGAAPCLLWREADRSRWQSNLPVSGISARILPLHWNYGHPGIQVINILTHKWQFYSPDGNLIQCITIIPKEKKNLSSDTFCQARSEKLPNYTFMNEENAGMHQLSCIK